MDNQLSIFDVIYPKFKIDKPIKLIEMFGGYGSQYLSLKYLGANVEHHKLIEWAAKSIQAYNDIHIQDYTDYSKDLSDDEVLDKIYELGVSLNYNEPATREQLKRQNYRRIYNNIIATDNLVNIQKVKGKDLEITESDKYIYICSYSFPCQDLSNAGLKKGFNDTSTRSGMLWEVERILDECNTINQLPQVLLMENVIQVHSSGENCANFNKWKNKLEQLGYKNYFQDLIATDYGIPQTRNRTFMISILGDYSYTFPKPIPLKLKLKDMLEENVDEKYYLSDNLMKYIQKTAEEHEEYTQYDRYNGDLEMWCRVWEDKSPILNTKCKDTKIYVGNKSLKETLEQNKIDDTCYIDTYNKRIDKDKSGTITTGVSFRNNTFLAIKNATKQGYLEATDGDCVGVAVKTIGNYSPSNHNASRIVDKEHSAPTVMENHGTITATQTSDLRIRKLTPYECFALMGVKREDFENCAKNQSDSSLYHLAGDSIVVDVLMAIFKEMI